MKANKFKYGGSQCHVFVLNSVLIPLPPQVRKCRCGRNINSALDKIECSEMYRAEAKEHDYK